MKKNDFFELVKNTNFDEATKQLFITSYCIGYDQGKIETLKEVIERMDYSEIKRKLNEHL
jgi:hypothetical protein